MDNKNLQTENLNPEEVDFDNDYLWDKLDRINNDDLNNNKKNSKKNKNKCINCDSLNLIKDCTQGRMKCIDCGVYNKQVLDEKAEWSVYDDGKNEGSMRCGAPTSMFFPKSSMSTTIGGNQFSIIKRIQNWDQMPYYERSLSEYLQIIENHCYKASLPKSVIDNAKILYKQVHELKHTHGKKKGKNVIIRGVKNRYGIYGACTFIGAQMQNYYRTTTEIAIIYNVSETVISNGCNKLRKLLKHNKLINSIVPTTPIDFIERYCYKLNLEKQQIDIICRIVKNVSKLYLASNHQPISIGAGCVLIFSHIYNVNISKKFILQVFNITAVTTDKIFDKILPFRHVIIDDDITNMVRDKMIESKYIGVDSNLQQELENNTKKFKQELIDLNQNMLEMDLNTIHESKINFENKEKPRKQYTKSCIKMKKNVIEV